MKLLDLDQTLEVPDKFDEKKFLDKYIKLVEKYKASTGGTFGKHKKLSKKKLIRLRLKSLLLAIKYGV